LKKILTSLSRTGKEIDFGWSSPAFLEAPEMAGLKLNAPICCCYFHQSEFITWLKLRLEYVITGNLAPADMIPDPLAIMPVS